MAWKLLIIHFIINNARSEILENVGNFVLKPRLTYREERSKFIRPILKEYDFIVVGAGTAGCAVASRLAEVSNWSVLLLEAGEEATPINDIPLINQYLILTNYSWGYKVEPQEDVCLGLEDGVCIWPSGKGVGGTTIMNAMLMIRGHPSDYDEWAERGNPDWSYEKVLPYFLKSENMLIPELKGSPYHSTKGAVAVDYPYPSKLIARFVRAGEELGYNFVDYNDARTPVGFSPSQISTKNGRRFSAVDAYLLPIKDFPNFHIAKNAFVNKVLIDPESKQATGVSFIKNGKERIVCAKKEVILSAGSFNSPQLLMVSGVGKENHLNEFDIPVIMDLPVGDYLQEHLTTIASTFLINTTDSVLLTKLGIKTPILLPQFLLKGDGILANNAAEGLAYINTENKNSKRPNVEFFFLPLTLGFDLGLLFRKTLAISDEVYYKAFAKLNNKEGWMIVPSAIYPKSMGQVRLRSSDARVPPKLIANFLSYPEDIQVGVEAIKAAIRLGETKAFQEIGSTLYTEPIPGCEDFEFGSDEYFGCVLKTIPVQFHHQCCTCKMGPDPERHVLNERLQVYGIKGLRVVDLSITPSLVRAHSMATVYMIGEKAADIIKEDWKQ